MKFGKFWAELCKQQTKQEKQDAISVYIGNRHFPLGTFSTMCCARQNAPQKIGLRREFPLQTRSQPKCSFTDWLRVFSVSGL